MVYLEVVSLYRIVSQVRKLIRKMRQVRGALLFSVDELMALKEAISGFAALITWMVPQSGERDGVIESLQGLYQQFSQMLSPFVN